ncbi:MAG: choice-of-anchor R domain-containing protein [Candidatus Daviesbacteria bacterium]|nr:choice-of-anchor R domain-containing protein [Candidatus Daviesbacteria bacterium]
MIRKESGQILILTFIALGITLFTVLFIIAGAQLYFGNAAYSVNAEKATSLAEAGLDKALTSLNKTGGSYNGESETSFGDGEYSVVVTNKDTSTKIVQSTGYIPNKSNPKTKRTVQVQASTGAGISFVYGMLVGNGGISMGNGSQINGSIYSNGNILGGNNETITGDAYVAGGTEASPDQQTDCFGANCTDFIFGKTISGNSQLDVAQSFKPGTTTVLNKVQLKLKKIGNPGNLTVRILGDSSGSPNKNSVLASGTLGANLVTTNYGFIDVTFTPAPNLTANTVYWIMIDTASNSSNYWAWSEDLAQSYTRGAAEWSPNWSATNPVWGSIPGDLGFMAYMGGVATSIDMANGSVVQGNVHANTINGITINKDAYYQIINNSTVRGTAHPNSIDPAPVAMPISQANIDQWKADAENAGPPSADIESCHNKIGPGKIVGKIEIENQCTVTVTTPIWVTGDISVGNNVIFKMDPGLGSVSGMIIVDGQTNFANGNNLLGTGVSGSYLMLLSTYNSQTNGIAAIATGNSSITGILYAPFGILSLANNANFKEAVAWQINMGTGTILTYDSGLISTFFSAGPSGSFSLVKGSYQVK